MAGRPIIVRRHATAAAAPEGCAKGKSTKRSARAAYARRASSRVGLSCHGVEGPRRFVEVSRRDVVMRSSPLTIVPSGRRKRSLTDTSERAQASPLFQIPHLFCHGAVGSTLLKFLLSGSLVHLDTENPSAHLHTLTRKWASVMVWILGSASDERVTRAPCASTHSVALASSLVMRVDMNDIGVSREEVRIAP